MVVNVSVSWMRNGVVNYLYSMLVIGRRGNGSVSVPAAPAQRKPTGRAAHCAALLYIFCILGNLFVNLRNVFK